MKDRNDMAKTLRYVIRYHNGDQTMYVCHRGHDAFGSYYRYSGKLEDARIYLRNSDAEKVARMLTGDMNSQHEVIPVETILIENWKEELCACLK